MSETNSLNTCFKWLLKQTTKFYLKTNLNSCWYIPLQDLNTLLKVTLIGINGSLNLWFIFVEVLQDPAVMVKISDTKAASEVKVLEQFYTTLQFEPAKAFYGKKHIEKANEAQAIETLLISDKLFRFDKSNCYL